MSSLLFPAGAASGLVGLVLLVLECTRALTSNVLGAAGTALLWVGVALTVLGAVLLFLAVLRSATTSDSRQPANG